MTCECDLKDNYYCPLNAEIDIPCKNVPLFNGFSKMFLKTIKKKDSLFWQQHFGKNIFRYFLFNAILIILKIF